MLYTYTVHDTKVKTKGFRKPLSPNTLSAVHFCIHSDLGSGSLKSMSNAFGFPVITEKSFQWYEQRTETVVMRKYEKVRDKVTDSAFEYYKKYLQKQQDSDGILDSECGSDSMWMTRGHNSLIGVGIIAEVHTGFVLDGVLSKPCFACRHWDKKHKEGTVSTTAYGKWKNQP